MGRMARPKLDRNATPTTERLLSAAATEFGAKGFDGARLSDIAASVGISRPSLLYHYKSKQALYAAVVRTAFTDLGAMLVGAFTAAGTFEARFEQAVAEFTTFLGAHPAFSPLLLREMLDDRGPGRAIVLAAGVPVLDRIERFVREEGAGLIDEAVPVRPALMQIVSAALLAAAAGPMRAPLWGDELDHTMMLSRALLLRS